MGERGLSLVLVVVGVLAIAGVVDALDRVRAPRPPATGAVGEVTVYGQGPDGPRPLTAGRPSAWPRPQAFAFQLTAAGTGPRLVRVGLDRGAGTELVHEARLFAPADAHSLDFVARLGESAPDDVVLEVTVEAPHRPPVRRRYPIRLATESHRFWDPEVRAARARAASTSTAR